MTDQPIKLNAWAINYETQIAVQGEVNSRTLSVTLIDRLGSDSYVSNAESIDRPIDLTGVTARLYIKKGDGTKTFSDGVVTDAENGKVDFELPYQATTYAGDNPCQILLTKADNSALKITGLTLNVLESDLEGAIESTDEFSALVVALNSVNAALEDAGQAVTDAQTAINSANQAITNIDTAITNMQEETQAAIADTNAARDNANNAATAAKNLPYVGEDHYWYTYNTETGQYEKSNTLAGTQYAAFEITSNGDLQMATSDSYDGASFSLNDNGELEVTI